MTENKRFYYAHGVVWDTEKPNGLNGISINDLDNGLRVTDWLNELNQKLEHNRAWGESNAKIMFSLSQYLQAYDEILNAFINGIEDEKGIDPNNQQFQEKMNFALKYLKRLKEEYTNVDEYLEKKKELEKMTNIHQDCENYSPKKDYCLKYFEENVSENYPECKEKTTFNDKELSRKWSN